MLWKLTIIAYLLSSRLTLSTRSVGEHAGTTQGPNICPQVEQEGKLHSECWCRQGRSCVGTGSVGYWAHAENSTLHFLNLIKENIQNGLSHHCVTEYVISV